MEVLPDEIRTFLNQALRAEKESKGKRKQLVESLADHCRGITVEQSLANFDKSQEDQIKVYIKNLYKDEGLANYERCGDKRNDYRDAAYKYHRRLRLSLSSYYNENDIININDSGINNLSSDYENKKIAHENNDAINIDNSDINNNDNDNSIKKTTSKNKRPRPDFEVPISNNDSKRQAQKIARDNRQLIGNRQQSTSNAAPTRVISQASQSTCNLLVSSYNAADSAPTQTDGAVGPDFNDEEEDSVPPVDNHVRMDGSRVISQASPSLIISYNDHMGSSHSQSSHSLINNDTEPLMKEYDWKDGFDSTSDKGACVTLDLPISNDEVEFLSKEVCSIQSKLISPAKKTTLQIVLHILSQLYW